jgi:translation elongation factor EF-1alpha
LKRFHCILKSIDYGCCRTTNEICDRSTKSISNHLISFFNVKAMSLVITFTDLAGHTKYMKTTIFGLSAHAADFAMLCVDAPSSVGVFIFSLLV